MNKSNLEMRKIKSLDFLYEISEDGKIFRNCKSKKHLKVKLDMHHSKNGYYVTFVRYKGKPKRVMIHKAVAECWLGDCPDGYEVDHIDRNTHNNHYSNLRYVTKSEQMKNRDHSNISRRGCKNLEHARQLRAKPVEIRSNQNIYKFDSYADTARFLATEYDKTFESMRYRLKKKRSHIYDYDIIYLSDCRDYTHSPYEVRNSPQ